MDNICHGYLLNLQYEYDKKTLALLTSISLLTVNKSYAKDNKLYDGSWESLQKMEVPAWFDDGKIGIFIHWGHIVPSTDLDIGSIVSKRLII